MSIVTLNLPQRLYEQLALQAEQDGVPLESYIVYLLSQPRTVYDLKAQQAEFDKLVTRYPANNAEDALREVISLRLPSQNQSPVTLSTTSETLQYWASRPYVGSSLRERLNKATALIVPGEGYVDHDLIYFPQETEQLFQFLQNKAPELLIDVCVEDSDYKELSRYSDIVVLAGFVVTALVAPVVVNLVSDYLKNRLGKKEEDAEVRWTLTVQSESGASRKYTYEGPASIFREEMQRALNSSDDSEEKHDNR